MVNVNVFEATPAAPAFVADVELGRVSAMPTAPTRPAAPAPRVIAEIAPASRPSGRYAVGLRPSLDPDAYLDVRAATEDSPNLRSPRS